MKIFAREEQDVSFYQWMMKIIVHLTRDVKNQIVVTGRVVIGLRETCFRREEINVEQSWPLRIQLLNVNVIVV